MRGAHHPGARHLQQRRAFSHGALLSLTTPMRGALPMMDPMMTRAARAARAARAPGREPRQTSSRMVSSASAAGGLAQSGAESIERDPPPTSTSPPPPPDEPVAASLSPNDGSPDEDPSSTATPVREGDVLSGKYRVEGVIGGGGMGVVFSAQHLQLQTRVALKVLRPDVATRGFAVARLLREAR